MREGQLVPSTSRGRYALDDAETGPDLTSGQVIEVYLNGQWLRGSIEHAGKLYADETTGQAIKGYYFIGEQGGVCGLCTGMKVRIS